MPRVTRTIPPAIRRLIFRRDRGRCIVPGCRSTRHLEVHHVIPRAAGGTHDPRHLGLLCSGHHDAVHAGRIEVTGEAPTFAFRRLRDTTLAPVTHVDQRSTTHVGQGSTAWPPTLIADAHATLEAAGFSRTEAVQAVRTAIAQEGDAPGASRTLESLVRAALRALRPRT